MNCCTECKRAVRFDNRKDLISSTIETDTGDMTIFTTKGTYYLDQWVENVRRFFLENGYYPSKEDAVIHLRPKI